MDTHKKIKEKISLPDQMAIVLKFGDKNNNNGIIIIKLDLL